jgi:hypothetical protein
MKYTPSCPKCSHTDFVVFVDDSDIKKVVQVQCRRCRTNFLPEQKIVGDYITHCNKLSAEDKLTRVYAYSVNPFTEMTRKLDEGYPKILDIWGITHMNQVYANSDGIRLLVNKNENLKIYYDFYIDIELGVKDVAFSVYIRRDKDLRLMRYISPNSRSNSPFRNGIMRINRFIFGPYDYLETI